MEYEVTADFQKIDFGASGTAAVLQNVAFILTTPEFSCPLDRDFAWNPDVDMPIQLAQAQVTARLTEAIYTYEPRAEVVNVTFQGDGLEGKLKPVVRVRINGEV